MLVYSEVYDAKKPELTAKTSRKELIARLCRADWIAELFANRQVRVSQGVPSQGGWEYVVSGGIETTKYRVHPNYSIEKL